ACAGQPELRRRLEALLQAHFEADGFMQDDLRQALGHSPTPRPSASGETIIADRSWEQETEPGAVIGGRYTLLKDIGAGGMGRVWLAEQTQPIRRKVAVKLIKPGMDSRPVLARFEAERQALAMMDHPNIATVLDGGTTELGRPFFVMELVPGTSIVSYCDERHLPIRSRVSLLIPVCRAVDHAHQRGVLHRDLKPSNILVSELGGEPSPKIIDFGLAKALHATQQLSGETYFTAIGTIIGTPSYMAPEQAAGLVDAGPAADTYALGAILYELLT